MPLARIVPLMLICVLTVTAILTQVVSTASGKEAVLIRLDMAVDGGAVSLIERAVNDFPGKVYIIEINSYGGYLAAADRIISTIERSGSHCVAWIPPGNQAISAAALIALSCREIYMAPGAVIGGMKPSPEDPKVVEYVKAKARSLLERRGKNGLVQLVDDLVDRAKSYTAEEASALGLARLAKDLGEVLDAEGLITINTAEPGLWDHLLSVISNPLISQLMLFAGIILILAEVFTTGFQGYAVAGVLLIVFALYSMVLIPVEMLHLTLVLSGAVLLAVELFTPGFGAFGIAGVILTTIGFALTFTSTPRETVTGVIYSVAGGLAALTGLFLFIAVNAAKAVKMKRASIQERLIRAEGVAKTDISENVPGTAYVLGEDWTAYSTRGVIPAGSKVRVVRIEGLKLYVEECK
ncbi:MAG: NfeD family protein [Desulfurococcaceae archaeon]